MQNLKFNFDHLKDLLNTSKHGLSLKEGAGVYLSENKLTLSSPRAGEDRLMDVALLGHRVLILVYVERGHEVRFISLRHASKQERLLYEQWKK
jgi:hypothetical protein